MKRGQCWEFLDIIKRTTGISIFVEACELLTRGDRKALVGCPKCECESCKRKFFVEKTDVTSTERVSDDVGDEAKKRRSGPAEIQPKTVPAPSRAPEVCVKAQARSPCGFLLTWAFRRGGSTQTTKATSVRNPGVGESTQMSFRLTLKPRCRLPSSRPVHLIELQLIAVKRHMPPIAHQRETKLPCFKSPSPPSVADRGTSRRPHDKHPWRPGQTLRGSSTRAATHPRMLAKHGRIRQTVLAHPDSRRSRSAKSGLGQKARLERRRVGLLGRGRMKTSTRGVGLRAPLNTLGGRGAKAREGYERWCRLSAIIRTSFVPLLFVCFDTPLPLWRIPSAAINLG